MTHLLDLNSKYFTQVWEEDEPTPIVIECDKKYHIGDRVILKEIITDLDADHYYSGRQLSTLIKNIWSGTEYLNDPNYVILELIKD